MKTIEITWDPDKEKKLISQRGLSFIIFSKQISDGNILEVIDHYNPKKYKNQKIYLINLNNYVYLVPFIKNGDEQIFLKTIIPSRKHTKLYLKK